MAKRFETASTAKEELAMAKKLHRCFGYWVRMYDRTGNEVHHMPNNAGFKATYRVTIGFDASGIEASRVILDRRAVFALFGDEHE